MDQTNEQPGNEPVTVESLTRLLDAREARAAQKPAAVAPVDISKMTPFEKIGHGLKIAKPTLGA